MYEVAEYFVLVVLALIIGGFSFMAFAIILIAKEGFDTAMRELRAR